MIVTAADAPDVRAVVAQVPFVDPEANQRPGVGYAVRALLSAVWDLLRSLLGLSPDSIPVVAPPGEFGVINVPGAWDAFQALQEESGVDLRNEVPARVFFAIGVYRPTTRAAEVRCPLLLVPARGDTLVPLSSVKEVARIAPAARLEIVEGDHCDVYRGALLEQIASIEADFLAEHL